MDEESKKNVRKIFKYEDDEIGSYLTDNFIVIKATSSISAAMKQMIASAGEHDNIFTLFAVDDDNKYVGAIDLKDLIISRKDANLDDLIMRSYPSFYGDQKMEDCIDLLKDYNEDLIPILNRNNMIDGAITIQSVMDASEEEMEKDYAMLGGLSEDDDIDESIFSSIKKRIPWLIILLFLGIIVSSVIGVFEAVIATLPVVVFFQSMILDMAGNAGTQSLAVTIRNIGDEGFINDRKKRRRGILKEIKLGLLNGLIIGTIAFIFVFIYLIITKKEISSGLGFNITETLKVSGIISFSMFISITISSMIGTLFPLFLEKIHIDPAVASGPFITTINDIVSVAIYYGLIYIFFILLL
ncbi:MAG: magnesium transporter, partial [Anaeroplasma sp.]